MLFSGAWVPYALRLQFLALVYAASLGAQSDRADRPIPLCEVMQNLRHFQGKMVSIVGEHFRGTEISAIGDRACQATFITYGHKWPNALSLTMSSSRELDGFPVNVHSDRSSIVRYLGVEKAAGDSYDIFLAVRGQVLTRESFLSRDKNVTPEAGFGHLGVYGAVFVVATIEEIRLVPRPLK